MESCFNEALYPQNFVLLGTPERQKGLAERIVSDANTRFPEMFEGKKPFFFYELRYVPPFDKEFYELKRLQGTAAEAAGRRDEFRGYVIIDLSHYLTHEKEHYFDITLRFLIDMSDCWKYIFLVDNSNPKAAKELVGKMLTVLLRDISCEVKEDERGLSAGKLVDRICKEQNVVCSSPVKEFLQHLLENESFGEEVVSALLRDISSHCGKRISMTTVTDFFAKREPVIKYMLSQRQFDQLMCIYECRKENRNEEKAEV